MLLQQELEDSSPPEFQEKLDKGRAAHVPPQPALSQTCVAVQDLAVGCCQLKHFQLGAVGGHNNVGVTRAQELHIQNLLVVSCELEWKQSKREKAAEGEGGNGSFSFNTGCNFYTQEGFLAKPVLLSCFYVGLWAKFPQTSEIPWHYGTIPEQAGAKGTPGQSSSRSRDDPGAWIEGKGG